MVIPTQHTIREAYISLGDGRMAVDGAAFFCGILSQAWDANNTDGQMPTIAHSEEGKNVRFINDHISVYSVSDPVKPSTVDFGFENSLETIAFEVLVGKDRPHAIRVVEELKRVVQMYRRDTYNALPTEAQNLTGRMWTEWGRNTPFDRNNSGFYRRVIEVIVHWEFREIQT